MKNTAPEPEQPKIKLWARLGVSILLTPEEALKLEQSDNYEWIGAWFQDGRFFLDGDTYFPCECQGEEFAKAGLNPSKDIETFL